MIAGSDAVAPGSMWIEPDISGLVTENEILSEKQGRLLTEPLYSSWAGPLPRDDGEARRFAAFASVGLFSSIGEPPLVPDMMLSVDTAVAEDLTEKKNRSYFVWQFGKPPEVVVEIVCNGEGGELGERLRRYQRMRVSYYIVHDPLHALGEPVLRSFAIRGDRYVPVERPWFESIGLGLIEWDGVFEGLRGRWLRWCTLDGRVVPTGAERAEAAVARAGIAEARVERLAARLRELGIDPNDEG